MATKGEVKIDNSVIKEVASEIVKIVRLIAAKSKRMIDEDEISEAAYLTGLGAVELAKAMFSMIGEDPSLFASLLKENLARSLGKMGGEVGEA